MNKEKLSALIEENKSFREIARIQGVSLSTIRHWARKHGLKSKVYSRDFLCKGCGKTDPEQFVKMSNNRRHKSTCKRCHCKKAVERFRRNKRLAVEYKGGKCQACGYDRCFAALVFHHSNPKEKDPDFNKMRHWNFEKTKKELDKCELLCANCHAEAHNGAMV